MAAKQRSKAYLWVSRLAGLLGVVMVVWAVIGGLAGDTGVGTPQTLLLIALCGFLVAIWALLYGFHEQGVGPKV